MYDLKSLSPKAVETMGCREREVEPLKLAPFDVDGVKERPWLGSKCHVRRTCCEWAHSIEKQYSARVLKWIDVGRVTEKQACVLEMRSTEGQPLIVVAFRGSRTTEDWFRTNFNMFHQPLRCSELLCVKPTDKSLSMEAVGVARPMHWLKNSSRTCISAGMWRAYNGRKRPFVRKAKQRAAAAGSDTHMQAEEALPSFVPPPSSASPRQHVRAVVEHVLQLHAAGGGPRPQLILTGHSMGAH